ncbi:MAG: rod shape-determining protein MreD [Anaerolineae bacterium]
MGLIIIFSLTLAQSTLGPFLAVGGARPDLVLVFVVAWTLLNGFSEGLPWAFVGGLALDLLSGAPFGVFTVSLLLTSFVASLTYGRTFGHLMNLPLLLILPLSFLFNAASLLWLDLLGRPIAWGMAYRAVLFPAALYDLGAMLLLFPAIYGLFRLTRRNEIDIA